MKHVSWYFCLWVIIGGYGEVGFSADACFSKFDNQDLRIEVVRSNAPPFSNFTSRTLKDYDFSYPISIFSTATYSKLTEPSFVENTTGMEYINNAQVWVNFCQTLPGYGGDCQNTRTAKRKGNWYRDPLSAGSGYTGSLIRPAFTSYKLADNCTLAQTAHALGEAGVAGRIISRTAGLSGFHRNGSNNNELRNRSVSYTFPDGKKYRYFINLCILSAQSGAKPNLVQYDYEPGDNRSVSRTLNLVSSARNLLGRYGVKIGFMTNELTNSQHGIDSASLRTILHQVDLFSFFVHSGMKVGSYGLPDSPKLRTFEESFAESWDFLNSGGSVPASDNSKVVVHFSLFGASRKEAKNIHDIVLSHGFMGINLHDNHIQTKDPDCSHLVNQVIRCLTLGRGQCGDRQAVLNCAPQLGPVTATCK